MSGTLPITRTISDNIKKSLNFKQYISDKPHISSRYMVKTPFVRVISNAVKPSGYQNYDLENINPDVSKTNKSLTDECQLAMQNLVTRVESKFDNQKEIFFNQTINGYIHNIYYVKNNNDQIIRTLDGLQFLSGTYKLEKTQWNEAFTSGSYDTLEDIYNKPLDQITRRSLDDKKISTSFIIDQKKFVLENNNTPYFIYEQFLEDPSVAFNDFFNVMVLVELKKKNSKLFKKVKLFDANKKEKYSEYYILNVQDIPLGASKISGVLNSMQFLVDINDVSKNLLRYKMDKNASEDTDIQIAYNEAKHKLFKKNFKIGSDEFNNVAYNVPTKDFNPYLSLLQPDDSLAREYTLETITPVNENNKYEIPGGIRMYEKDMSFGKEHYGLGIRPKPGIVSFEISTKGVYGVLRKGKLKIKAFTMEQLETIQKLYMNLGTFLFVEWGWTVYPNLNIGDFDNASFEINRKRLDFFSEENTPSRIKEKVLKFKEETFGHYDATFAIVSNFSWVLDNDGVFDITVDLTSQGSSIMGMKPTTSIQSIMDAEYEPLGALKNIISLSKKPKSDINPLYKGRKYISLGTILNALAKDISGVGDSVRRIDTNKGTLAETLYNEEKKSTDTTKFSQLESSDKKKYNSYIERAEKIIKENAELKDVLLKYVNVTLSTDPIRVLDIGDEDGNNFLTSLNPSEVLILNKKNKKTLNKYVPCFGDCEYDEASHLSKNIDLKQVIFIEYEKFKTILNNSNNIDSFLKGIFEAVKTASSEVINLIYTIGETKEEDLKSTKDGLVGSEIIKISDSNSQDYTFIDQQKNNEISSHEIFQFSIFSKNSIVTDFSFTTRLPSSFQRAAFVSSTSIGKNLVGRKNSVEKMLRAFSGGFYNNLKKIDYSPALNNISISEKIDTINNKIRYQDFYNKLMQGERDISEYDENKDAQFMSEFRFFYYRQLIDAYDAKHAKKFGKEEPPYFYPPVGINLTLTIDGTSGVDWGNLVRVDYLPLMLQRIDWKKKRIPIFFVQEVVDTLTEDGWKTKLVLLLRAII